MISIGLFFREKKYFASAFLFFCFSLIFSTWVTYIPYISDKIGITEGRIGKALFFAALGAFFMIRICKLLVNRVGVGRFTYFALIVYCFSLFGPFLAFDYISLCVSLFLFGMASSSFSIGLNSLIATIEKQDGKYILTGSHGFWSIGGMIGASTGGYIAAILQNPILHISMVIFILIGAQTLLRKHYYYRKGELVEAKKLSGSMFKPLIVIALVGLFFMLSEGALADWSALYLKKIILLNVKYIGFGYAAFSLAMMLGRFTGDALSKKLGSWKLLTYAGLISIFGFSMVLVIHPMVSLIGFFVVGLGFSIVIPEVYRLASKVEGINTSDGVSFLAATNNIGFLVGPVILGLLAELESLHLSFMVLTGIVSLAFFISFWKMNRSKG
jgi:MFS family permease